MEIKHHIGKDNIHAKYNEWKHKKDTYLVVDGKLKESNNKISCITNLKPYLQKLLREEGKSVSRMN